MGTCPLTTGEAHVVELTVRFPVSSRFLRAGAVLAAVASLLVVSATLRTPVTSTTADASAAGIERVALNTGRAYLLAAPDPAVGLPLVLVLHGRADRADAFLERTGVLGWAAAGQAVVAAPETAPGLRVRSWNAGSCCDDARDHGVDDVAFLDAVIRDVTARTGVSASDTVLVGFSNGAMLGYRFACERPWRVSSLVAVGGQRLVEGCRPSGVALLVIHGAEDDRVPPTGMAWSELLGSRLPGVDESVGPFTDPDVVWVAGTGHWWPASSAGDTLDATEYTWQWLSQQAAGPPPPPSR